MTVFYSMMVWIFIVFCFSKKYKGEYGYQISNRAAFITFAYIIILVGLRSEYIDTHMYIQGFEKTGIDLSEIIDVLSSGQKGPAFSTYTILFKHFISDNYHWWLMSISIFCGILIMIVIKEYSENFYFSTFLFITSLGITWMMNGIRQFIAVAIVFVATKYLIQGKWFKYFLFIIVASMFHATAIIMMPVYFIVRGKPWSFRVMMAVIITILIIGFVGRFTVILEFFLEETNYANATMQFLQDNGVNPIRVLFFSLSVILSVWGWYIVREENNQSINIMINMSIVTVAMYAIGGVTSGILIGRLPIYTELYITILLPYLFNHCFNLSSRRILYPLCMIIYFCFFYLQMRGTIYVSDVLGTFT